MVGYDKLSLNFALLYHLTLEETLAAMPTVGDRAKPHHTTTPNGGTIAYAALPSGLPYFDLTRATPDYLDCPAAATNDLDFITGDFSGAIWVYRDLDLQGDLICKSNGTTGYIFTLNTDVGEIRITTYQAAANQSTNSAINVVPAATWTLLGFSRNGAVCRVFANGRDVTDTAGTHIDPDSAAALDLNIGVANDKASNAFDGRLTQPRLWGRELSAMEHLQLFNMERHWFNV